MKQASIAIAFAALVYVSGCGGSASQDRAAESGGGGGIGGGLLATGGLTGAGGAALSCHGRSELCSSDCSLLIFVEPSCQVGQWLCPAGYLRPSQCPAYACNPGVDMVQCCDPATGLRSSPICDETGKYARCAAKLDLLGPNEECVVKPEACRVRDAQDLEGQACTAGDPECDFGTGYVVCGCTCGVSGRGPAWGCACALH